MEWLLNLGYVGLFAGSFIAATVVPFSSDVLLLALLTWLPVVGDVFAIALGFYKVDFKKAAVLMLIGKGARFVCWALLFIWGKQYF